VHVKRVFDNKLAIMATGTNAKLSRLFASRLFGSHLFGSHLFASPIHRFTTSAGKTFQRPTGAATAPAVLQGVVAGARGLRTEPLLHLHSTRLPTALAAEQRAASATTSLSILGARCSVKSAGVVAVAAPTSATPAPTRARTSRRATTATRFTHKVSRVPASRWAS